MAKKLTNADNLWTLANVSRFLAACFFSDAPAIVTSYLYKVAVMCVYTGSFPIVGYLEILDAGFKRKFASWIDDALKPKFAMNPAALVHETHVSSNLSLYICNKCQVMSADYYPTIYNLFETKKIKTKLDVDVYIKYYMDGL